MDNYTSLSASVKAILDKSVQSGVTVGPLLVAINRLGTLIVQEAPRLPAIGRPEVVHLKCHGGLMHCDSVAYGDVRSVRPCNRCHLCV